MRMLAQAGVLVGFCGGGGTPLLMATEIEWMSPQSEYRPTEYVQGWLSFWFDEAKRLQVAKQFQQTRISFIERIWLKDKDLQAEGFASMAEPLKQGLQRYANQIEKVTKVGDLLMHEASLTKQLYKLATNITETQDFNRQHDGQDLANAFLNHGNYLAYGLAATTLWVLGIPHGFAVMHGKTRRGALVFDVADLVKDAIVLPWAFICAKEKMTEQEFRQQLLQKFTDHNVLEFMFNQVKQVALKAGNFQGERD